MRTSRELAAWIAQGERGSAADTIVEHLTGIVVCASEAFGNHPRTPTELRQCFLLLQVVPTLRTRLRELQRLGPEWSMLVEHWGELEASLRLEGGLGDCHETFTPQTYLRLASYLARADEQRSVISA